VGKTRDGVILDLRRRSGEPQCNGDHQSAGTAQGQRIVRGREADGAPYYQKQQASPCFRYRTLCGIDHGVMVEKRESPTFAGASLHVPLRARVMAG